MIELLTVIAIICFLIGVIVVVALRMNESAKVKAARAQLDRIGMALQRYYGEFREYPPDTGFGIGDIKNPSSKLDKEDGTNKEIVVYDPGALWRYLGQDLEVKRSAENGPVTVIRTVEACTTFTSNELKKYDDPNFGTSYQIIDPWGQPIGYVGSPGRKTHNRDGVDLFSCGPDRKTASTDEKDNGIGQGVNNAYDGQDNDGDGTVDNATELGEASLDGGLTRFKEPKTDLTKKDAEILDDVNNWDPQ